MSLKGINFRFKQKLFKGKYLHFQNNQLKKQLTTKLKMSINSILKNQSIEQQGVLKDDSQSMGLNQKSSISNGLMIGQNSIMNQSRPLSQKLDKKQSFMGVQKDEQGNNFLVLGQGHQSNEFGVQDSSLKDINDESHNSGLILNNNSVDNDQNHFGHLQSKKSSQKSSSQLKGIDSNLSNNQQMLGVFQSNQGSAIQINKEKSLQSEKENTRKIPNASLLDSKKQISVRSRKETQMHQSNQIPNGSNLINDNSIYSEVGNNSQKSQRLVNNDDFSHINNESQVKVQSRNSLINQLKTQNIDKSNNHAFGEQNSQQQVSVNLNDINGSKIESVKDKSIIGQIKDRYVFGQQSKVNQSIDSIGRKSLNTNSMNDQSGVQLDNSEESREISIIPSKNSVQCQIKQKQLGQLNESKQSSIKGESNILIMNQKAESNLSSIQQQSKKDINNNQSGSFIKNKQSIRINNNKKSSQESIQNNSRISNPIPIEYDGQKQSQNKQQDQSQQAMGLILESQQYDNLNQGNFPQTKSHLEQSKQSNQTPNNEQQSVFMNDSIPQNSIQNHNQSIKNHRVLPQNHRNSKISHHSNNSDRKSKHEERNQSNLDIKESSFHNLGLNFENESQISSKGLKQYSPAHSLIRSSRQSQINQKKPDSDKIPQDCLILNNKQHQSIISIGNHISTQFGSQQIYQLKLPQIATPNEPNSLNYSASRQQQSSSRNYVLTSRNQISTTQPYTTQQSLQQNLGSQSSRLSSKKNQESRYQEQAQPNHESSTRPIDVQFASVQPDQTVQIKKNNSNFNSQHQIVPEKYQSHLQSQINSSQHEQSQLGRVQSSRQGSRRSHVNTNKLQYKQPTSMKMPSKKQQASKLQQNKPLINITKVSPVQIYDNSYNNQYPTNQQVEEQIYRSRKQSEDNERILQSQDFAAQKQPIPRKRVQTQFDMRQKQTPTKKFVLIKPQYQQPQITIFQTEIQPMNLSIVNSKLTKIRQVKQLKKKKLEQELAKLGDQIQNLNKKQQQMHKFASPSKNFNERLRIDNNIEARQKAISLVKNLQKQRKNRQIQKISSIDKVDHKINDYMSQLTKMRLQNEQKLKERRKLEIIQRMKSKQMKKINQLKKIQASSKFVCQFMKEHEQKQSKPQLLSPRPNNRDIMSPNSTRKKSRQDEHDEGLTPELANKKAYLNRVRNLSQKKHRCHHENKDAYQNKLN